MRTLVVGDIHGGLEALKQVLIKVSPKSDDQFIFLGDYVDGWSESAETVSFLLDFSVQHQCIFLRGNHDELAFEYLDEGINNPMWLNHGGASTKKSYDALCEEDLKSHLLFFEGLHNYYIDDNNRLFCHAGFTNQNGPQYEYFPKVLYWDRTLWEMACGLDGSLSVESSKFPKRLKLFKEIFIGHTPVTRIGKTVPVKQGNVWNIDTGAAFKGPLSIMDVNTKEVWQSDPVWRLYPDEKGRN